MNKKTVFIAVGVGAALLGVIGLTLLLLSEPQDTRSRADNTTPPAIPSPTPATAESQDASCPSPSTVSNVLVEFPNCVGDVCNFTEASCSWGTVTGASQYKLTITEVETGNVIQDDSVEASVTKIDFSINQGNTYKCDVSAINSCGAVSAAASHSLLCEADALIEESPTPSPPPVVACGFQCASTADCDAGLTCAIGSSGAGYCAIPAYQSTCSAAPSVTNCCTAPTLPPATATPIPPTLAPAGIVGDTLGAGAAVLLLVLIGAALFVF